MTIAEAENQLDGLLKDWEQVNSETSEYVQFYLTSSFYPRRGGSRRQSETLSINLLKTFADKNIQHTAALPTIKVPLMGTDADQRRSADIREKILYATYRENGMALKQVKLARDATKKKKAVIETYWNFKKRCVEYIRHKPEHVFWVPANNDEDAVEAVYIAYPMSKTEAVRRFKVSPGSGRIDATQFLVSQEQLEQGDHVLYWRRIDAESRMTVVGDKVVETPHKHLYGFLPVDVVVPFEDDSQIDRADFYLRPLIAPQAELNESFRKKANIVRKLGNPTVWGRGIMRQHLDVVKSALAGEGGFVGLKGEGELGILQPPETQMIDKHIDSLVLAMMRLSGFGQASFGETFGANTSGDAIGMHYAPTTRSIEEQQIFWKAFHEAIQFKTLALYAKFLKTGETKKLNSYRPRGAYLGVMADGDGSKNSYDAPGFALEFTKEDIGKNFESEAIFPSPTPKDEIAYKRLLMEAVRDKMLSRDTAYEEWGLQSPADEFEKLRTEQQDSAINPEGTAAVMGGIAQMQQAENSAMAPAPGASNSPDPGGVLQPAEDLAMGLSPAGG